MIKRVIHKARNHRQAERWDLLQQIEISPEERQQVAKELKKRFFGDSRIKVRTEQRYYMGLDDLIAKKRTVGRARDKDDLWFLTAVRRRRMKRGR
jgi:hypothetical protein